MCLLPCVSHEVWASSHQSPAVTDGEALSASLARPPLGGSGERLATSDCARYCWLGQRLMVCCVTAGPARTSRTSRGPRSRWRKGTFAHLLPNLLAASISFVLFFYIIQMLGSYFELYFLEFVQPNAFLFLSPQGVKGDRGPAGNPGDKGDKVCFSTVTFPTFLSLCLKKHPMQSLQLDFNDHYLFNRVTQGLLVTQVLLD